MSAPFMPVYPTYPVPAAPVPALVLDNKVQAGPKPNKAPQPSEAKKEIKISGDRATQLLGHIESLASTYHAIANLLKGLDRESGVSAPKREKKSTTTSSSSATAPTTPGGLAAAKPKKRKKDPNAPKNPLTAYTLFTHMMRERFKEEEPGSLAGPQKDVVRRIAELWRNTDEESRKPYIERASELRAEWSIRRQEYLDTKNGVVHEEEEEDHEVAHLESGDDDEEEEEVEGDEQDGSEEEQEEEEEAPVPAPAVFMPRPAVVHAAPSPASVLKKPTLKPVPVATSFGGAENTAPFHFVPSPSLVPVSSDEEKKKRKKKAKEAALMTSSPLVAMASTANIIPTPFPVAAAKPPLGAITAPSLLAGSELPKKKKKKAKVLDATEA